MQDTIVISSGWIMLELDKPSLLGMMFLSYVSILAWTELIPQSEQSLKRIEALLENRLSKRRALFWGFLHRMGD